MDAAVFSSIALIASLLYFAIRVLPGRDLQNSRVEICLCPKPRLAKAGQMRPGIPGLIAPTDKHSDVKRECCIGKLA